MDCLAVDASGLNITGRSGLNQLMTDVENKQVDFNSLLVYDVSRWGRFQNVDESAYYEYILKRAGIRVHYCAEQFENDGSMSPSVLKTLKRPLAAEYSRELSVKVFSGQCLLIELGICQGGHALQDADIFAVAGPEGLAVLVLAKPVHMEDARHDRE